MTGGMDMQFLWHHVIEEGGILKFVEFCSFEQPFQKTLKILPIWDS